MMALLLILALGEALTTTEMLLTAVGTLAGVVGVLFTYLRVVDARQEKKLTDCENDRRALWQQVISLGGRKPERES